MGLADGMEKHRPLEIVKALTMHKRNGSISSNVQVAVRIRPLNNQENYDVVSKHADAPVVVVDSRDSKVIQKQFEYDYVFDEDVDSDTVYGCVTPLIQSTLAGYNATVFAYGQTGSGKTYTMGSDGTNDSGIIPCAVRDLFERTIALEKADSNYKVNFRVRFLEVYGEEVRDLLSPTLKKLTRVSDRVSEESIASVKECLLLLQKGMLSRKTGKTKMNAMSSRSHAIFTVLVKQTLPGNQIIRESYFNFVDLAGSERQKKTLAEGLRFKEGVDINKGLLALGNVINALSEGKNHVPYRDSKLTKMLQESLGGNSQTLMLACISPARRNISETLNSLEYASRARRICNALVLNQKEMIETPMIATEAARLRHEILLLINERDTLLSRVAQLERTLNDSSPCCYVQSDGAPMPTSEPQESSLEPHETDVPLETLFNLNIFPFYLSKWLPMKVSFILVSCFLLAMTRAIPLDEELGFERPWAKMSTEEYKRDLKARIEAHKAGRRRTPPQPIHYFPSFLKTSPRNSMQRNILLIMLVCLIAVMAQPHPDGDSSEFLKRIQDRIRALQQNGRRERHVDP